MKNSVRRQLLLIKELKYGRVVNLKAFCSLLKLQRPQMDACPKTITRDVAFLRKEYGAPIKHDRSKGGYRFEDGQGNWSLCELFLENDALFALLFSHRMSDALLPSPVQKTVQGVMDTEVAAAQSVPATAGLLASLVVAPGFSARVDEDVYRAVLQAWRETRTLTVTYWGMGDATPVDREIYIHALCLWQGLWYARASGPVHKETHAFALDRIKSARLTPRTFTRDSKIVREVASGNVFGYTDIVDARIWSPPEKARFYRERTWFPNQRLQDQSDGSLVLEFPGIPLPVITQWVMACMGDVTVLDPPVLRDDIRRIAALLLKNHPPPVPCGDSLVS